MKSDKRKTVTSTDSVTGCGCVATPTAVTLIKILKAKGSIRDKIKKLITENTIIR